MKTASEVSQRLNVRAARLCVRTVPNVICSRGILYDSSSSSPPEISELEQIAMQKIGQIGQLSFA